MKRRTIFALAAAALTLTGAALAAATPGPHRALCPSCMGLTEIAPGLWTDDPATAPALRRMAAEGAATVSAFFGTPEATPRLILCQTKTCQDAFAIRPSAVTYGASLILVAPKGVTEMILTHELTHVALHRRQGVADILDQRFPAWFDEGLASLVSNDTRLPTAIPEADRRRSTGQPDDHLADRAHHHHQRHAQHGPQHRVDVVPVAGATTGDRAGHAPISTTGHPGGGAPGGPGTARARRRPASSGLVTRATTGPPGSQVANTSSPPLASTALAAPNP